MRPLISVLAAALLAACAVGPDHVRPTLALPQSFDTGRTPEATDAAATGVPRVDAAFWQAFSDPQLDEPESLILLRQLLLRGARVFMTGTVEVGTYAASLMHSGNAKMLRYAIHCTQEEMLSVASQNDFGRIIAYRSDYAPTQSVYEI